MTLRADIHAFACRIIQAVGAGASLIMVGTLLDPALQGVYFTMLSLMGLQVLAELGLSLVLLQATSHEAASMTCGPDGRLSGTEAQRARVYQLLRLGTVWFGVGALILGIPLLVCGRLFLFGTSGLTWSLDGPWFFSVIGMLVSLLLIAPTAVLEGSGQVSAAWRVRLAQQTALNGALVLGLLLKTGLWALAAGQVLGAAATLAALWPHRAFYRDLWSLRHLRVRISWRQQIWPFQWRIAVSWLAGFLLFQLAVPLVFALCGPVEAGRLGLSWQAMRGVSFLAITVLSTRMQRMGSLSATQSRLELDALFNYAAALSMGLMTFGTALLLGGDAWLAAHGFAFASRMIDLGPLCILGLASILQHLAICQASYLRAHLQEPFLWPSVLGAVAFAVSSYVAALHYGVTGVVTAYLAVTVVFGTGLGTFIFMRQRRLWNAAAAGKTKG